MNCFLTSTHLIPGIFLSACPGASPQWAAHFPDRIAPRAVFSAHASPLARKEGGCLPVPHPSSRPFRLKRASFRKMNLSTCEAGACARNRAFFRPPDDAYSIALCFPFRCSFRCSPSFFGGTAPNRGTGDRLASILILPPFHPGSAAGFSVSRLLGLEKCLPAALQGKHGKILAIPAHMKGTKRPLVPPLSSIGIRTAGRPFI